MNIQQFNQIVFLAVEYYKAKYTSKAAQSHFLATKRAADTALNEPVLTHAVPELLGTELSLQEESSLNEYKIFIMELDEYETIEQAFVSAYKTTNEQINQFIDGEVKSVQELIYIEKYYINFFQKKFISDLNNAFGTIFLYIDPLSGEKPISSLEKSTSSLFEDTQILTLEALKKRVQEGADINEEKNGCPILEVFLEQKNYACAEYLIDLGAKTDTIYDLGFKKLIGPSNWGICQAAAAYGTNTILDKLHQRNANLKPTYDNGRELRFSMLHAAAEAGNKETLNWLLRNLEFSQEQIQESFRLAIYNNYFDCAMRLIPLLTNHKVTNILNEALHLASIKGAYPLALELIASELS